MAELLLVAASERELVDVEGAHRLACGIGPVEAALATAGALAAGGYRAVLHVGIAGALALPAGTVVLGSEAIYCDVLDPRSTQPRVFRLSADPGLLGVAAAALSDAQVAPIATCARVGGGLDHQVEAMEGFGVLRAAGLASVPALEVRVISNAVAQPDRGYWQIADALAVLAEITPRLVESLLAYSPD
jgi:nucleoside phosphorylase